jgi:rRNA maturation protein Nop10
MACNHVYEYVNAEICPLCGRYTHEPNYELQNKLHRQWIAEGKNKHLICPLGGSIIGAWDI